VRRTKGCVLRAERRKVMMIRKHLNLTTSKLVTHHSILKKTPPNARGDASGGLEGRAKGIFPFAHKPGLTIHLTNHPGLLIN
jgi:hypothetical protein